MLAAGMLGCPGALLRSAIVPLPPLLPCNKTGCNWGGGWQVISSGAGSRPCHQPRVCPAVLRASHHGPLLLQFPEM